MRGLYGHGLIWDAFSYANQNEARGPGAWFVKTMTALSFTGGCCAIVLNFAPVLWRSKTWVWVVIGAAILLPTTWILAGALVSAENPARLGITLLWTLFSLGGVAVLTLPILVEAPPERGHAPALALGLGHIRVLHSQLDH